jgi:predicted aconitase
MEDSRTIGFVEACFVCDAIDTTELNRWAEHVMISAASAGDYPLYVVHLSEFREPRFHFVKVVGFTSDRRFSDMEKEAISGIAVARGRELVDGPSKEMALAALRDCPHILAEYRATFPFIEISAL